MQDLMIGLRHPALTIDQRRAAILEGSPGSLEPIQVANAFSLLDAGPHWMGFVTVGRYRQEEREWTPEPSRPLSHLADGLTREARPLLERIATKRSTGSRRNAGYSWRSRPTFPRSVAEARFG